MDSEDYVIKRNGEREIVSFDKILRRIKNLGEEAGGLNVNYTNLCIKIIDRLYNNIPTKQIDELTSQQCASLTTTHPDYGVLAGRVVISNHQKNTTNDYLSVISSLYNFNDINGNHSPLISDKFYNFTKKNIETINNWFDYKRDFLIDYFGFKTLERAYLMKVNGLMVERPQHMWMRVAIAIHMDYPDWKEKIKETYDLMSQKYFTHATPTLFNAGTKRQQMSSCYLLAMKDDSIDGIYDTLKQTALISKWAGGIGLHIHNVRADGTLIRGTNGTSNGIVPMLRVFNNTARYVDQCILPETYIYTTEGPKQIQHCESNKTNIFNSKSYECIENILEHSYNGEILSIETMHSIEPLKITDEHPVYCIRNQKKTLNYSVIKNRLNKNIIKPEWCDAKDLTYEDLLIFKIPEYEKNIENITKDDCYMYGLILGDGSMNNSSINCYLSLNAITKTHILDFTKTYLTNKCIQFFITRENNTNRIRWNKNSILPFRYNDIYDENREKKIHPKWLNLPIDKIKFIVKGLIDSDGSKGNELVFDTTSRNLLESLRYLLLRMGIPTSGYIRDRIGQKHTSKYGDVIENKRISYCLRIPKTDVIAEIFNIESGKFFKFFIHEKFIYSRIKNITKENYRGTLYDLQMKSTHDYMIHNGIVHNGGGKRAGSFAMYIEPWHADIESFLDMKKNHGDEERRARDLFYALWMPDLFMKRVQENGMWTLMCPHKCPGLSDVYGDRFEQLYTKYENENRGNKTVKARDIWFKILDSQIETGTPYILYKDAANQKSNQKNLGTIKSSNLCVAPETLILTDKGHIEIQTLKNKTINVWNGKEFSETTVKQTSNDSELITIDFSDGSKLTCTKYHKFYIQTKYPTSKMKQDVIKSKNVSIVEAQNLKPDMKLIKCAYPIIDNKNELKSAYTNGIFSADGTYTNISEKQKERKCNFKSLEGKSFCKRHIDYQINNEVNEYCCGISYTKKAHISLYGEKIKLLEYLDYRSVGQKKDNKLNVTLSVDLKDKFFVPINYSLKSKLDWFAGYCDGDGSIAKNDTNQSLQISCIHKDFLLKIKLMLQTCGIASKVSLNMNERLSNLPDGRGGMAYYKSKNLWRILVGSNDLQKLLDLGFSPKRLIIDKHTPQRNATQFVKISKITDNNRTDKTFCFNEPLRHAGIFNGVITSNCTEIIEYSDANETAVCNLASISLSKMVKDEKKFNFQGKVILYTKDNCKWCLLLKALLKRKGVEFLETEIMEENFDEFKKNHNVKTLPQVKDQTGIIGGYDYCRELVKPVFDYKLLHKITKIATKNLNKIIDLNFYPTPQTKNSNLKHRPIGLGVQGLADAYAKLDIPFHSEEAKIVNTNIFETIYHASLEASMEISRDRKTVMKALKLSYTNKLWAFENSNPSCDTYLHKSDIDTSTLDNIKPIYNELKLLPDEYLGSYSTFCGSPASEGKLQFDLWNVTPSTLYDWDTLRLQIAENGLRNSLLVAPMPTASTSQILGNNECFEPFTSNIYVRRTIAGEFVVVNKYLLHELIELGLWTEEIKNEIIRNNGSIQDVSQIPKKIKEKYKIVWEIPMKHILDMCADRGAYICQSQSTNLWMKEPTYQKLTSMHFYSWKKGLKTGIYYLRTKAKAAPQQFTIEPDKKTEVEEEECLMCGS
jgi:ribonucleoside-diphosphate reductase alpha chain